MQVWVLHVYNDDGTLTVTIITNTAKGMDVIRSMGKECTSFGGPMHPKLGDRVEYRSDNGVVGYAALGQVVYN